MARNIYLSPNEDKALRLLAEGRSHYVLRDQCVIPLAGMAVFTQNIRRKTGIHDTRYPRECRLYVEKVDNALANHSLTPEELRILEMYANGETSEGIGNRHGKTEWDMEKEIAALLQRIGIFAKDPRICRFQARIFLVSFHKPNRPHTPQGWQVLRLIAEGRTALEIADELKTPVEYARFKVKETCALLGLTARGRDVQRNLVRAYLETHAEHPTQPDMNDPMF